MFASTIRLLLQRIIQAGHDRRLLSGTARHARRASAAAREYLWRQECLWRQRVELVAAPDSSRERKDSCATAATGAADRTYSVQVLTRIAEPVLKALSRGKLKKHMPLHYWEKHRAAWTHYEAFARTLAGIAPWIELGPDETPEGCLRARFISLARQSLINATDPRSPSFLNFGTVPDQPLVEFCVSRRSATQRTPPAVGTTRRPPADQPS